MKIDSVIDSINGISKNIFRFFIQEYFKITYDYRVIKFRANKFDNLTLLFISVISNNIEY